MLLHNSTALQDLDRSYKLLNTRIDLLLAAYPSFCDLELDLLGHKLQLEAQLDQLINIFETQGWASFNKEPATEIFTVELLPTTNPPAALSKLKFVLGQTTLHAFCPNTPYSICIWGHPPTVLSRIGVLPSCGKDWDWPMTTAKLVQEQEQTNADIVKILNGSRTALDLLMY